ncbi:hypothetical protein FIBSPDRAFT_857144 [Athelia psychrophila]|uniref:Uncharacterized protein n=1 Tax=Athelia psychrophila TaxID=1759441 RepID=A0A166MY61_9AGAM|nr:hypothetical protein FIBSPDRAFT_857144 [Fibularhizoctonia sp. CBS 109695]
MDVLHEDAPAEEEVRTVALTCDCGWREREGVLVGCEKGRRRCFRKPRRVHLSRLTMPSIRTDEIDVSVMLKRMRGTGLRYEYQ